MAASQKFDAGVTHEMIQLGASPLLIFAFMMLTMAVVSAWFLGVWVSSGQVRLTERIRAVRLIRIGLTTLAWMITVLLVAASGVLLHFDWRPPPIAFFSRRRSALLHGLDSRHWDGSSRSAYHWPRSWASRHSAGRSSSSCTADSSRGSCRSR